MTIRHLATLATITLATSAPAARAQVTVTVPGTADVWLSGVAPGTRDSDGQDTLANAAPLLVPGLTLTPGATLKFAATGNVANDPANPVTVGPNGGAYLGNTYYQHDPTRGFASLTAPINSLVGVFLDDATPDFPIPNGLDYSGPDLNGATVAPALRQPFVIGDGSRQGIVVPAGATRLFLGAFDQSDSENNLGSFAVTINGATTPASKRADLVGAFTGVKITAPDLTQPKPKLKIAGTYALTNAGVKKAKNFTLGAYLSGAPTVFAADGKTVRPDVLPLGVVPGVDATGKPTLTPVLTGGIDKIPGLNLAGGAALTLPLPNGTRVGPNFTFNLKQRVDNLPISLKGRYVVVVADAEGVVPEDNRKNDEAFIGPLP